jgi:hypothetical protein
MSLSRARTAALECRKLEEERASLEGQIREEEAALSSLTPQIKAKRAEIEQQRHKMGHYPTLSLKNEKPQMLECKRLGGARVSEANKQMIDKELKILKSRTANMLFKYNKAKGVNANMKLQINDLRQERVIFDRVFKRLEQELMDTKHAIRERNEEVKECYKARDQAQVSMVELKNEFESDRATNLREWNELGESIETNMMLEDKNNGKNNGNGNNNASGSSGGGSPAGKLQISTAGLGGSSRRNLNSPMRSPKGRGRSDSGGGDGGSPEDREDKELRTLRVELGRLEDVWGELQQITGVAAPEDLEPLFDGIEKRNFEQVKVINELTKETDTITDEIKRLVEEKDSLTRMNHETNDERSHILSYVNKQWEATKAEMEEREKENQLNHEMLSNVYEPVHTIFFKVGCEEMFGRMANDVDYLAQGAATKKVMADPSTEVNQNNIMIYIGAIEQRAIELIEQYADRVRTRNTARITAHERLVSAAAAEGGAGATGAPPPPPPQTIPVPRVGPAHGPGGTGRLKINAPQFNDKEGDGDSMSDEEYVVVDKDKSITDSIVSKIPKKKSRRRPDDGGGRGGGHK